MKGFIKNRKGEKGFTLVELLIVFTLLGVLAAIVIPNIGGLVGYGHSQSAEAELSVVQTAMDAMMAKDNVSSVTAGNGVSDFSAAPTGHFLYPSYLRFQSTQGTYDWDDTGLVSQNTTGYE